MSDRAHWSAVVLLGLFGALGVRAQSPSGNEFLVNRFETKGPQGSARMACERSGLCMLVWESLVYSEEEPGEYETSRLEATIMTSKGDILREKMLLEDPTLGPASVLKLGSRFAVFWDQAVLIGSDFQTIPRLQWYSSNLEPLSPIIHLPAIPGKVSETTATPGGFVQLSAGYDMEEPASDGAFLTFSDFDGHELGPSIRVSPEAIGEQRVWTGGLTVDAEAATMTVVYSEHMPGENAQSDIFYRRFSLAGDPFTSAVRVNTHIPDWQIYPAVATAPNGVFVVTWTSEEQDGSYWGVFGQRFARTGLPLGQEFQINQETFSDQGLSQIAMDESGNFVVVWSSYDPGAFGLYAWDVKARLYRADGTPVGPEIFVNRHRELEQRGPLVAFVPNGTFVVSWASNGQIPPANENLHDTFARRFSASSADEPCIATTGKLSCDTGRTGGELEVQHAFGGPGSGLPFLGDIDGDGREDPCLYFGGIFRCDADHEGGAAEVLIPFTIPGATVPLLGDMDGDGRDDPCLFGAGTFHCDTRHDGGAAEVRIVFGQKGETPLLGDVNGDGRADACAFAGGLFRCDTAHNGGKAELHLTFGRRGDQPLLGDFDGDGRDDPCVFRKGKLLCDTAHNGGVAEGVLSLGGAKDRVVLGNLDGL